MNFNKVKKKNRWRRWVYKRNESRDQFPFAELTLKQTRLPLLSSQ
jgi:hypothetical protein